MGKTIIKWKEEEPLVAQNRVDWYINIATALLLVVIFLSHAKFLWLDGMYAAILSIITVALRVALYGFERREDGYKVPSLIMYILAILGFANITFIIYEFEFWTLLTLAEDKITNVEISAYFISAILISLPLVELLKREYREDLMEDINTLRSMDKETSKKSIILLAFIALMVIGIVSVWFIMKDKEGVDLYMMFFWMTIAAIVPSVILFIVLYKKKFIPEDGFDIKINRLTGFIIQVIISIIVIILVPTISRLIILIQESENEVEALLMAASEVINSASAVIGQSRQTPNYFSWVLYILLQDRVPALMISFMIFGAVSAMLIQNMGGVARVISGFALSITVIIPLLFIVTIITGGIPPPIELEAVLGYGTAGLVYALAQTSAFILMLAIIGVFVAGGQFLGGIMGTDR